LTLFRPLFDDMRYKIDVSNLPGSARTVFTVRKFLKVVGASLTANFTLSVTVFYVLSAEVYLEVFLRRGWLNNMNRMWKLLIFLSPER